MNTRILVFLSLLIGIGAVLHAVIPPFFFGMRPDMMLAMMFLGIILFPKLPYVFVLSIATGLMSALTTTVPGGQLANLVDKPLTALAFLGMFLSLKKILKETAAPVLTAIGTIISGSMFLSFVLFFAGIMEASFGVMFITVVLPAAAVNTIAMTIIYPIAQNIMKRTHYAQSMSIS
ncbi:tryptophan transporter [Halobacillus sp. A1]|uniref:tryptophan transporter n=1 Tax=Halobacillus sp. A1 TaxID=2880262 RepID=UPI0020A629AA|nr:tryptophan transporter [Halobacillus sp. A1]MCP3033255.1 tryptophan transporter [Halobacillus sp. A1]